MATWSEFATAAPGLAGFGSDLFKRNGAAFLATVRGDGSPRLHPVVPIIAAARLFVFINPRSPKFRDLRDDRRYVLHALIDKSDDEFQVSGRAAAIDHERTLREAAASAAPYEVPNDGTHFLFEFNIERALATQWYHPGQPDTRPVHQNWTERPRGKT